MLKVVNKVWYECPACKGQVSEDEVFVDCRSAIGMYGAIVLADIWCKCGFCLVKGEIIDNDGNIPPAKRD